MTAMRDPGLQPERTRLAWSRTSVAMAINALLTLRTGIQDREEAFIAGGIALAFFAGGLAAVGRWRSHQLQADSAISPPAWLIAFAAAAVLSAALFGAVACLTF